ncbi:hypothetical protein BK133_00930 [Paenibacillus sp. FSL H8-0548]|uniref:Myb-like DNA-binding domain-containing protein n=1 Tax=Paenibacillus sp. FSL H8-0548 TaxID=1920422 RepID=UPI00096C47BC|nr:Myb-like DNA-binding domain-containing protein [Paenibacillus sp. FSL H8-0548]OMF38798.1 hypothetical protein BK133_00930 [Paenibacillus sp. FSL H8-0548]
MTEYHYHGWTPQEEEKLASVMIQGMANRKKTTELFKTAAAELGRSMYSCQNRWYDIKGRFTSKAV